MPIKKRNIAAPKPQYVVIAAGEFATLGGDATESITVSGALASDIAVVTLNTVGSTPRTVTTATAASNAITVVMSGDPSTDHVLNYLVLRAAS
jgi:Ni,Fe-hydrogenase III small subunit